MDAPIIKHDEYVEDLYQRIEGRYEQVFRGLPLHSQRGRLVGEIDLVAVNDTNVDIFEVKCSFRLVKARKQLSKIMKLFGSEADCSVNAWFYCGEAAQLVKME